MRKTGPLKLIRAILLRSEIVHFGPTMRGNGCQDGVIKVVEDSLERRPLRLAFSSLFYAADMFDMFDISPRDRKPRIKPRPV